MINIGNTIVRRWQLPLSLVLTTLLSIAGLTACGDGSDSSSTTPVVASNSTAGVLCDYISTYSTAARR
jgi:hypothetical protein